MADAPKVGTLSRPRVGFSSGPGVKEHLDHYMKNSKVLHSLFEDILEGHQHNEPLLGVQVTPLIHVHQSNEPPELL